MRVCAKCGEDRDDSAFTKGKSQCAPCRGEAKRAWYLRNREHVLAYQERRRAVVPRTDETRRHIARHAEAIREYKRRNRQENLQRERLRARITRARQRAREAGVAVLDFTREQLLDRLSMFGGCWMCGGEACEIDHVKPLGRGGAHALSNIRPICSSCNQRKGSTWPLLG